MLDRRVATRWNSDFNCLKAHHTLRGPVEQLLNQFDLDLEDYQLDIKEWDTVEAMMDVLEIFDAPTKAFSRAEVPLVCDVIPMLEDLELQLQTVRNDPEQESIIRVAAHASLEVVAKYYERTDDTLIYRMAMGK